jgi:MerR HTH family regulatory protein
MTRSAASEAAADPVDEETSRGVYSIGAVSTMLGVPPATLRTWEARYGGISSERAEQWRIRGDGRLTSGSERVSLLISSAGTLDRGDFRSHLTDVAVRRLREMARAFARRGTGPPGIATLPQGKASGGDRAPVD